MSCPKLGRVLVSRPEGKFCAWNFSLVKYMASTRFKSFQKKFLFIDSNLKIESILIYFEY